MIRWLTGYTTAQLRRQIAAETSFKDFFRNASLNPHARLVTGMICGVRIEEIKTPLSRKIRILDKLVDELAKGRKMEQILRTAPPR